MITDGDNVDLRTFAERKDKPFILPDRMNAFEAFSPRMTGLILDCFYNFFRTAHSAGNPVLKRALSKSVSTDEDYLNKVILESLKNTKEAEKAIKLADEEKKEMAKQPQLKKSLSQLLDDFHEEDSDEGDFDVEDVAREASVAKDVNLMKLKSDALLAEADKREGEVYAGDGSDRYIPMN